MDEPILRRATPADLDAIHHIEQASFTWPWTRAMLSEDLNSNKLARYLVLELQGEVIGFAGAHLVLDEGHITNVAVAKEHRGKGYGARLIAGLMQYAANLGVQYMTLEVRQSNQAAISLYERAGFVVMGKRKGYYEETGEDAWLMACDSLPPAEASFREPETSSS